MDKKQLLIYNELISKYNFNEKQKHQIKIGVYQNLNVNYYLKPNFNAYQMEEIRLGLMQNLDV